MGNFRAAVERTLGHEGGVSDHEADRGGATNWGISNRFLESIGDTRSAPLLTREDAIELYRVHFWDPFLFEEIPDQEIAAKLFDLGVHMGPGWSARIAQRALRACGLVPVEDGKWGPATRAAIKSVLPVVLLAAIRSEAAGRYREIATADPSQKVFLNGWLTRAYS